MVAREEEERGKDNVKTRRRANTKGTKDNRREREREERISFLPVKKLIKADWVVGQGPRAEYRSTGDSISIETQEFIRGARAIL